MKLLWKCYQLIINYALVHFSFCFALNFFVQCFHLCCQNEICLNWWLKLFCNFGVHFYYYSSQSVAQVLNWSLKVYEAASCCALNKLQWWYSKLWCWKSISYQLIIWFRFIPSSDNIIFLKEELSFIFLWQTNQLFKFCSRFLNQTTCVHVFSWTVWKHGNPLLEIKFLNAEWDA